MTTIDAPAPASATKELLRRAGDGDREAWEQLVRRYQPTVAATVRRYRLQEADAADACQRTWLRMIEHRRGMRTPEALGGWLATTAGRESLRILRERRRVEPTGADAGPERADPAVDVEQRVVDADTLARVRRLMASSLPARSSRLLDALFEGAPPRYAELSRRTGIPMGSIGPTRARALARLRVLFDDGPAGRG